MGSCSGGSRNRPCAPPPAARRAAATTARSNHVAAVLGTAPAATMQESSQSPLDKANLAISLPSRLEQDSVTHTPTSAHSFHSPESDGRKNPAATTGPLSSNPAATARSDAASRALHNVPSAGAWAGWQTDARDPASERICLYGFLSRGSASRTQGMPHERLR